MRAHTVTEQLLVISVDDSVLLALCRAAVAVNAVEENPVSAAVDIDVARVVDVLENGHAALSIVGGAPAKVGVTAQQGAGPRKRRQQARVIALPIGSLALLEAQEDVLRLVNVDLVQGVVFAADAQHPGASNGFHQETAGSRRVSTVVIIKIVIGAPAPAVLPVSRRQSRHVSANSCSLASCGIVAVGLDLGASSTSKTEVGVEETNVSSLESSHVDFHKLATGQDICNSEEHVDKLRNADLAGISDLDHWDWVVGVFELGSSGADLRPNLSVESKTC